MTSADASTLMQRGIALLNESTPASLTAAVELFDQALALRKALWVSGDHWLAYLTAASWMNRGDALTRLGQPAQLIEALRSYDEALLILREAPLELNPLYRRRRAIALLNRGITLHAQETAASFAEAVRSFDQVIALLTGHEEHALILACAWMNRGNALLRTIPPDAPAALDSVQQALRRVQETALTDLVAAETGLKARHILCQAAAEQLVGDPTSEQTRELVAAATDAVEEGLELARHWETRGETRFRSLLTDLFRFGVAVYQAHQPQFLSEFVAENLDPARSSFAEDRQMHALAAERLALAARELPPDGFASMDSPRFAQLIETLRTLRETKARLEKLQRMASVHPAHSPESPSP
jgi:tetratricopeptide (TPR) repeat protein